MESVISELDELVKRIAPRPENKKTPNDFGFHKKSFCIKFPENEKDLSLFEQKVLNSATPKKKTIESKVIKKESTAKDISENTRFKHEKSDISENSQKSFDKVYEKHSAAYASFMQNYLYSESQTGALPQSPGAEGYSEKKKKAWQWGDEVINHQERVDYIKAAMMNEVMHAPVNQRDPGVKERYENWKNMSKFNMLLSFMMYEGALRS